MPLAALAVPGLLGAFLLLTSALDLLPSLDAFDEKRLLQSPLLACCLALGLLDRKVRMQVALQLRATPRWVLWALGSAATLGIVSGARFAELPYSLAEIVLMALLVATAFVVAACRHVVPAAFDRLSLTLLASLAVLVTMRESLGLIAASSVDGAFGFDTMLLTFHHPRFYNQLQTWMIPVLAAIPWVFRGRRALLLAATGAIIALQWCIVFISGGRGTALSVTLAIILVGLLTLRQRPRWVPLQFVALALGAMLYFSLAGPGSPETTDASNPTVQKRTERSLTQLTGRGHWWSVAHGASVQHPLLGLGPGRYACIVPPGTVAHPHNFPLQLAAEWGWPAAVLIAMAVIALLWRATNRLRRGGGTKPGDALLAQCLGASLLAATFHSGLSGVLIMPASQVAAAWIAGWAGALGLFSSGAAIAQASAASHRPSPNLPWAPATLTVAVMAALALSIWNVLEIERLQSNEDFRAPQLTTTPRYWSNGDVCSIAGQPPDG